MGACCAKPYERFFGKRSARKDARRYRRKGLDETAERLVDQVVRRGVSGASVLEIGGGIGAIELELLKRGAAQSMIVEISHGYDEEAAALLAEAGLEGRVDRRYGDFVEQAAAVEPADVVVLHRVVCCYPDPEGLVGAAAEHAHRLVALSFPRDTWWMRLGSRIVNVFFRIVGLVESYIHPPSTIIGAAHANGLATVHEQTGRIWRIAVFERAQTTA